MDTPFRLFALATAGMACALAQAPANAGPDLFKDKVQPVLTRSCLPCHNATVKQGGFDLSSREALLKGSEHGPVVVPGNPTDSQLFKLVSHSAEPAMPFKGKKLADGDIAVLEEWIKAGVPFSGPAVDPNAVIVAEAVKHWAFKVPVRPPTPKVKDAALSVNPIDAFLQAEREKRNLTPRPEADKRTLVRRVYVDLTGLVPTEAQTDAFLADKSSNAYEKLVDKLLESPRYGERWGRHWLDIWRYSDWYGYRKTMQVRYSQKHVWRWRDWTVDSLNENKPYDRMIEEMLAGDELAPDDPKVVRATGYLVRNWYRFNRNVWLQDTVEYTSAAFLGLTMKCARCHTHKYDPIPHTDYYRMRAFFEPHDVRIDHVPGEADVEKDGLARVYDADASKPTYRFLRGNEATPDESTPLQPGVPVLFGVKNLKIEPVKLPQSAYFPAGRSFVPGELVDQAKSEIEKAEADVKKAKEKNEAPELIQAAEKRVEAAKEALPALEARIQADLATMQTPVPENAEQLAEKARELELKANKLKAEADIIVAHYDFELSKKDPKKLAAATKKLEDAVKALKEPEEGYTPIGPKYATTSSGRRLALARWIASKDNPLTARVAINHMWLRHFGKPLVPTVFNFGRSGKKPTHPELLDWLATEFMDRNWDMKAMHRLMVTSRAYRMDSAPGPEGSAESKADPDNTYLWHANTHRMEAEAVRDSVLQIAGKLDTSMGGPEIEESKGQTVLRRSIYFRQAPDAQMEMLRVFDLASPNECFARSESIVPQQALALSNSPMSFDMSRLIAAQLSPVPDPVAVNPSDGNRQAHREPRPTDPEFVTEAFRRVLGRPPSAQEKSMSVDYLTQQASLYKGSAALTAFSAGPKAGIAPSDDPAQRARESLVHVLLNHNDFVTIR